MRFVGLGRIAILAVVVAFNVSAGSAPAGVTLTGGKLVVGFATNTTFLATTLDRIDQITWSGG